jgi:hypothetical protein
MAAAHDAAHMGTFYCLVPYEVVWNAKMQKAVSHSLCDVSEHERAVSAALEQLFGHALVAYSGRSRAFQSASIDPGVVDA